jgi:hypothetical protein
MYSKDINLKHKESNLIRDTRKISKTNKTLTVTSTVHMVRQTKPLSCPWVITTTNTLANEINKDTTEATKVRRANLYSLDLFQFALEVRPTFINGDINNQVRYKLRSY